MFFTGGGGWGEAFFHRAFLRTAESLNSVGSSILFLWDARPEQVFLCRGCGEEYTLRSRPVGTSGLSRNGVAGLGCDLELVCYAAILLRGTIVHRTKYC